MNYNFKYAKYILKTLIIINAAIIFMSNNEISEIYMIKMIFKILEFIRFNYFNKLKYIYILIYYIINI